MPTQLSTLLAFVGYPLVGKPAHSTPAPHMSGPASSTLPPASFSPPASSVGPASSATSESAPPLSTSGPASSSVPESRVDEPPSSSPQDTSATIARQAKAKRVMFPPCVWRPGYPRSRETSHVLEPRREAGFDDHR